MNYVTVIKSLPLTFNMVSRYVLPSVLFTNRAQCYLSMNKWEQAIDDCTEAIIRSYEGTDPLHIHVHEKTLDVNIKQNIN